MAVDDKDIELDTTKSVVREGGLSKLGQLVLDIMDGKVVVESSITDAEMREYGRG